MGFSSLLAFPRRTGWAEAPAAHSRVSAGARPRPCLNVLWEPMLQHLSRKGKSVLFEFGRDALVGNLQIPNDRVNFWLRI